MSNYDPKEFINRDKEVRLVMNIVSDLAVGKPYAPKERVLHFVGPSGIGKSCLLERFYKGLLNRSDCVPLLVRLDALKQKKGGLIVELLVAVHNKFCKCKSMIPKKDQPFAKHIQEKINGKSQIPVLFLDEINVPNQKDMKEIEEYLLANFILDNNHSILITAGRSQPAMFNDFALRPNASNTFPLPAFNEENTGRQMETLKPGWGMLAGEVVKLGSGVPGNTVKLVKHVSGNPPTIANAVMAIQALVNEIKKTNKIEACYYPMLEVISILQGFFPEDAIPLFQCHPQLGTEWDEDRIKDVFLKLSRIQIGPGGLVDWDREKKHWAMDESTRDLFEKELQMRDPELWKKLHCTALRMYREWGQKYNSGAYRNKANHHQQRLQSAGLTCNNLEG